VDAHAITDYFISGSTDKATSSNETKKAEELQGTHPDHENKPSKMKPEIVQLRRGATRPL